MENPIKHARYLELRRELSEEWNKPKRNNLRKDSNGKVIDHREPRDYKHIRKLQDKINELKRNE